MSAGDMTEDELLSAFLDGALAPAAAAALSRRIAAEPLLAQRLDALATLKATLSGLDADLTPPALPPEAARPVLRKSAAAALAAVLALGVVGLIWLPDTASEPPQVSAHRRFIAEALGSHGTGASDLTGGGLALERVERVAGGLYAAYRGPHGCRLGVWTGPPASVPAEAPRGWRVAVLRRGAEAVWIVAEPAMGVDRFAALVRILGNAAPGSLLAEVAAEGAPCRA